LNITKSLCVIYGNAKIKKCMRYLILLAFFLVAHFCARAQQFRPKWVDDLGSASGSCTVTGLAVDKQNNIYVTGYFSGTVDFDPTTGVINLTANTENIFVGKYKPDGALIWVGGFMGDRNDESGNIAVDKDGNVSVSGKFYSTTLDVDPGPGVFDLHNTTTNGDLSVFIVHLDTNGKFLWAYALGGTGPVEPIGVAADSQDNVVLTTNSSISLTVGDSTYAAPLNSGFGLIIKYGPAGNVLWSVAFDDTPAQQHNGAAVSCAIDSHDNILVSGVFSYTVNLNPLGISHNITSAGSNNQSTFLAEYSPSGILSWANQINGDYFVQSVVCVDPQDNAYYSTTYQQSITFNNSFVLKSATVQDICFAKYSAAGVFEFAKSTEGEAVLNSADEILGMVNDNKGDIYLTGFNEGTINFNPNAGKPANLTSNGSFFLAEYDQNGNYLDAFSVGSPNCTNTNTQGIAIDTNNNVDLAGTFCSTENFDPTTCSAYNVTAQGVVSGDAFIAQYASPDIINDIITAPAITSFCTTGEPGTITGSTPTGGIGQYTYQWQKFSR
jgi:hypothetical protein